MKDKLPLIFVSVILLGMLALLGVLLFEPSKAGSSSSVVSQADDSSAPIETTPASAPIETTPASAPIATTPASAPIAVANTAAAAVQVESSDSADGDPAPKTVEPGPLAARRRALAEAIIRKQIERREARRARTADAPSRRVNKKNGSSSLKRGGDAASTGDSTSTGVASAGDAASADGSAPLTAEEIDAEVAEQLAELEQREPMTAVDNFSQSVQDVTEMWRDADIEITAEIAKEFKTEFDKMSAEERIENVHEALNYFDDNYLECLKAIAVDASEPAEVLEKTVYDLGNRDWDKVRPIFEEIAANPQHGQNAAAKEWIADHPATAPKE